MGYGPELALRKDQMNPSENKTTRDQNEIGTPKYHPI
jgi:hypothetical protein